ncbi:MAG: hypothetical protein LBK08_13570 [Treponema sp.]|jgi:hypothetical protein|nr:hypothetical protein [Treponema sp.]
MKRNLTALVFFFGIIPFCFSQDFGVVLNQNALVSKGGEKIGITEYSGTAIPWFAAPLGSRADLYFSGGISARYEDEALKPLPELYRSEITWNPLASLRLELGRIPFRENLSAVMTGLFDGAAAGFNLGGGSVNAGVFYTGLLYKKTAHIYLGAQDREDYYDTNVYFASRRVVAALHWEKTGIFDTGSSLVLGGVCQFDGNDTATRVHSQWLEAQFTAPLGTRFNTLSAAVFELAEETGEDPRAAFALSAELQWFPAAALSGVWTIGGSFASGAWNDRLGSFVPLTAKAQGKVLRPMLSGIALAETAYSVRFHRSFSAAISGAYFFRTDKTTYAAPDMNAGTASPLLGGELYGSLSWAPFSDVLVSLGGGVFLPQTGKVFSPDAPVKYRVELAAGISL